MNTDQDVITDEPNLTRMQRYGIIYKITNNVNGKIYIGQTTRSMAERWADHCCATKNTSRPIKNAIKKYGRESFEKEELITYIDQTSLDRMERHFIVCFGSLRPSGYNIKHGGKEGCIYTSELKKTLSASAIASWDKDRRTKKSEERKLWAATDAGKEQLRKMSDSGKQNRMAGAEKYWSTHDRSEALSAANEARLNKLRLDPIFKRELQLKRAKKVLQIDPLTGLTVKVWDCPKDTESIGCCASKVRGVCCGVTKTHRGYIWRYA